MENSHDNDCLTLGYAIIGPKEQWIDYTMKYVAKTNDLEFGKDVKELHQISSQDDFQKHLQMNANKTQLGVIFCTSEWKLSENSEVSVPCRFEQNRDQKLLFYVILYNWTLFYRSPFLSTAARQQPKDIPALRLKTSIDNALVNYFGDESFQIENANQALPWSPLSHSEKHDFEEKIEITSQDYPHTTERFMQKIDLTTNNGAFYFFIPIMINFILTINEILRDKSKQLRKGLTVMGMSHLSYWLSQYCQAAINQGVLTVIQIIAGRIACFDMFIKTPFLILFLFFFTFGMAMNTIGFMIATICSDSKNGYTTSYGFLLMAVVMELFLTGVNVIYYLYREDHNVFIILVRKIFALYPPFHYSKIFGDIAFMTNQHFDVSEGRWVEGPGFEYSQLFQEKQGKFQIPKPSNFTAPSTFQSYTNLLLTTLLFTFITWYADHVFPNNRGSSEQPFFFLSPRYWGFCKKTGEAQKKQTIRKLSTQLYDDSSLNYSVQKEKEFVLGQLQQQIYNEEKNEFEGLLINNLSKVYYKYPFQIKSKNDITALKNIFISVKKGHLLGLLGHNGAGKSTLIGILTGLLDPSEGSAQIYNLDLAQEIQKIQKIMGVCPQFDILWEELTAEEHLIMYSHLKGVSQSILMKEVEQRLREMNLYEVRQKQVKTYSGGMKRRVSLAISAIGNPKIIFLDEPTSGMDPKTRRQIWEMIRVLKRNRAIILTTHAMEEADALADRIAVIADGQLRCIGTSLYLKNTFGEGYRISLVINQEEVDSVIDYVKEVMPNCKIVDCSGGSLIIAIQNLNNPFVQRFLHIMEQKENTQFAQQFRQLVKDWGISHTTLEEVFMKTTKSSNQEVRISQD